MYRKYLPAASQIWKRRTIAVTCSSLDGIVEQVSLAHLNCPGKSTLSTSGCLWYGLQYRFIDKPSSKLNTGVLNIAWSFIAGVSDAREPDSRIQFECCPHLAIQAFSGCKCVKKRRQARRHRGQRKPESTQTREATTSMDFWKLTNDTVCRIPNNCV